MPFAHSFDDVTPPARFDATPWTHVRVEEAASSAGPWTQIDEQAIALDPTPESPNAVDLTTTLATLESGYFRFRFRDAALVLSPYSAPVLSPGDGLGTYPPGISLAGFRAAVGVKRDDAQTNELLDTYLAGALDFARRYTRRTLTPILDAGTDLVALTFHPGGRRRVRLPDAREIQLVTADNVELDPSAWRGEGVRDDLPLPYVFLRLKEPAHVVEVEGRFGFDRLPDLFVDAIIAHAARNYRERAASYADTVTIEGGDGSASLLSYFRQLPPRVQAGYDLMRVPDDWIGL